MMLKAGASTNQTTWLGNESRHNSHSDEYPLHMAALQGHLGIVKVQYAVLFYHCNSNVKSVMDPANILYHSHEYGLVVVERRMMVPV